MAAKAVTVTLGKMAERAQAHIAAGKYSTMSEVVREGLRALDREEALLDAIYKRKLEEALADPRPSIPAEEAFAAVRAAARERRG
jgi:antitoxin ParD1/3/4